MCFTQIITDGIRHVITSADHREFQFSFEKTKGRSAQEVDVHVRKCQTSHGDDSREKTEKQKFVSWVSLVVEKQASPDEGEQSTYC